MNELQFEISSNNDVWELIDKSLDHILIHKFSPNEIIEWWSTEFKLKDRFEIKDIEVRSMEMDIQTNLEGLKRILELNTEQLRIYQFDRRIADTLLIEQLPKKAQDRILIENGLKHFFITDFEILTIGSSDSDFLNRIEQNRGQTHN